MGNEVQIHDSGMIMVQIDAANKYPREATLGADREKFVPMLLNQARAAGDEFMISCIYCKPVGRKKDKQGNWGPQQFVTGPSVRMSEIMQNLWKHLRTGYDVDRSMPGKLKVSAICIDMQANIQEYGSEVVDIQGWNETRIDNKAKAMGAILERDLRHRVIGKVYADQLKNEIQKTLFTDAEGAWNFAKEAFAELGVKEGTLLAYFGKKSADDMMADKDALFSLVGIYNHMKENGASPEDIFADLTKAPDIQGPQKKTTAANAPKTEASPETGKQSSEAGDKAQPQNAAATTPKSQDSAPEGHTSAEPSHLEQFKIAVDDTVSAIEENPILRAELIESELKKLKYAGPASVPAEKRAEVIAHFSAMVTKKLKGGK